MHLGRDRYQDWCLAKTRFTLEYVVGLFLYWKPNVTFSNQASEKGSLVLTSVCVISPVCFLLKSLLRLMPLESSFGPSAP